MDACLIVTYRCNARCYMCNTWKNPSNISDEFTPSIIEKLPNDLNFVNITGGEPFLRSDLEQIVEKALSKTNRLVISNNGYFTNKIVSLAKKFGNRIGVRISIEGLPAANDELRGIKNGFNKGINTIFALHDMGIKDIGFGITVSDRNAKDMIKLYRIANSMRLQFATATTHNSYYFHKHDNSFEKPDMIASEFEKIAFELLKTRRPKNWFRAYFNMGLANKVRGGKRPLPCEVGTDVFFLDPFGNVMPCNGSDNPMVMGNLKGQSFNAIWCSTKASEVRQQVKTCSKECWMIGSAAPAMKKKISVPVKWIIRNKLKFLMKKSSNVCLDQI